MPRRSRKKAAEAEAPVATLEPTEPVSESPPPEPPTDLPHELPAEAPTEAPAEPKAERVARASPTARFGAGISLTEESDGPRISHGEDRRYQQQIIRFTDTKADDAAKHLLRDAGFEYRQKEGYWTRQNGLEVPEEFRTPTDFALFLTEEIGNTIRKENGLEPTKLAYSRKAMGR